MTDFNFGEYLMTKGFSYTNLGHSQFYQKEKVRIDVRNGNFELNGKVLKVSDESEAETVLSPAPKPKVKK